MIEVLATVVAALGVLGAAFVAGWLAQRREAQNRQHERKQRVVLATGSLKLGLLLSSRSVVNRLQLYANNPLPHQVAMCCDCGEPVESGKPRLCKKPKDGEENRRCAEGICSHNAGTFAYRLLRPLAHGILIEDALYASDLRWSPAVLDMLSFNHAAIEMLTGDKITQGLGDKVAHLNCWWPSPPSGGKANKPYQRIRSSHLKTAASQLIVDKDEHVLPDGSVVRSRRIMYHDDFLRKWEGSDFDAGFREMLEPVTEAIETTMFDPRGKGKGEEGLPAENPILWCRLVGYAYVCQNFFNTACKERDLSPHRLLHRGRNFQQLTMDTESMLSKSPQESEALLQRRTRPQGLRSWSPRHWRRKHEYELRFKEIITTAL